MGLALAGLGFVLPLLGTGLSAVAGLLPTLAAVVSGPGALAAGVLASLGGVLAYQEDIGGFRKLADGLIADFETFIEDTDFAQAGQLFAMRLARSISTGFSAEGISTMLGGIPQRISDFIFGFDETTTTNVESALAGTYRGLNDWGNQNWSANPAVSNLADGFYDGMLAGLATETSGSPSDTPADHHRAHSGAAKLRNWAGSGGWGRHRGGDRFCRRVLADLYQRHASADSVRRGARFSGGRCVGQYL